MDSLIYYTLLVLQHSGQMLYSLWLYTVVGVILGELLKFTSWTGLAYRGISKSPFLSVFAAVFLGMVSPLCTYGTVPVVLQLFRSGIPAAPLVAFLSASAMMNPQLFVMTWGGISPEMALARAAAVMLFGLLLGFILYRIPTAWVINPRALTTGDTDSHTPQCSFKVFSWRIFMKNTLASLEFTGFYLVIGILLGAVVEVFVPGQWIAAMFRPGHWSSVLLASLLGVPLYACGGGVIPLVRSLINEGMSKGAALAFFTVGPATRITPLMAIAAILRPLFLCAYILLLVAFSLAAGMIYH